MKISIISGLVGLAMAGATISAQASFTSPFNIDATGTVPAGGSTTIATYWTLNASGPSGAQLDRSPGPTTPPSATSFTLTPLGAGTLARFYMTVPATPTFPGMYGYEVTFMSQVTLQAGDSAYYKVGANTFSLGNTPGFQQRQIPAFTVLNNESFEFGFQSGPNAVIDSLQVQGFIATAVPEPATMALNGLVLVGAAAGWVWNRRRKVA